MDVGRCPTYALPWLAQFVGVRFTGAQVGNRSAMQAAILAEGNFNRGTVASIQAVVAPYLQAGGYVNIIERYPDPYSLLIQVIGDLNTGTYAALARTYATYAIVDSTFTTYADWPASNEAALTTLIKRAIPAGLVPTVVFLPLP
jgi:hypothetical protein